MNIVVAVRCLNEIKNTDRFMRGYDFADTIVVSDGGSTDGSVELLRTYPKVKLIHFNGGETVNGVFWNTDAPHMNFVLDAAKELCPDWLIFDDMDCVPTLDLRLAARDMFREVYELQDYQINAFRLYMWGDDQYFPFMNRGFDFDYTSLWAWQPKVLDIHADPNVHHGTLTGLTKRNLFKLKPPYCLLHKSWHPDTIDDKIKRQNAVGIQMEHPLKFAGTPEPLPEWAREE